MTDAFVLRNITAVNFYLYAQDFPLSGAGNAVFLGGNGSGKSVLLDAIQIVMTGLNKRYLDLNSRVSEGGRSTRTVREACLGLLDDGAGYERDSCVTYLALGFESADGSRQCTAGVCIEAKTSVADENVLGLFIADGAILRFDDFVHHREGGIEEKAWRTFLDEQRRKGQTIETFQRQNNRTFLRQLFATINANARGTQLEPDRARAAMRQALSFDIEQISSVTDFVKRYLLDDLPIEIDTFQARYATWRDMQKQIEAVEAEIKQVEAIRSLAERVMEDQFNTRMWSYGLHRAEYDRLGDVIARQRREVGELEQSRDASHAYQARLKQDIEFMRERLDGLRAQVAGTPPYVQLRQAETERERQTMIRRGAAIEAKPVFEAFKSLIEIEASTALPAGAFPAVSTFVRTHLTADQLGLHADDWPRTPAAITDAVRATPALSDLCARLEILHEAAALEKAGVAKDHQEVERLLKNLHAGRSFMSQDAESLLADLDRLGVPARSLSEVADITAGFGDWRGIVESILGEWVDAIIVEPKFMDRAYAHFDQNYKGSRAKLIQTENVSERDSNVRPGTLAETVTTDNPYARAFLNVRLGGISRARTAGDIRRGDRAASVDGKYAHGRGIEYRRLPTIPRLGKSVRDQQIAELTKSRAALEPRLAQVRAQELRMLALLEAARRAHDALVVHSASAFQTLAKIEAADAEIGKLTDLITELEAKLPKGAMEELKRVDELLKTYREEEKEENAKEKMLIGKIGEKNGAINTNGETRRKSAELAREAFPEFDRRVLRHPEPIGLELFVQRARQAYLRERDQHDHAAKVRIHFDTLLKERKAGQRSLGSRLSTNVHEYVQANPDQYPGFDWTQIIAAERTSEVFDWIDRRHKHLTETILRTFKVQIETAVKALVETMVHDFLSRLRANIEAVDRVKEDLNRALRGRIFMNEVYQIRQERDQDKEAIRYLIDRLDIVAPKATALMQSNPNPSDPDQVKIQALIELLTAENADDAAHRRRLAELADYRNYFRFSIDICDPEDGNRKISDLDHRRGKASGGQKFIPFYICLGVAAQSAYFNHLGGSKDAPPQSALLLMDEAFEKLDPDNIHKVIQFYKSLGLQLIMAAPKTHQAIYQENFDTLISIMRNGRALQATPQHFHEPARELLRKDNPMHKPRSYFEERARREA